MIKLCFRKAGLISLEFALVLLPPVGLSVPTDSQKQPYSGSSAVFADELKRLLLNFLWIFSAAFATVYLSFSERLLLCLSQEHVPSRFPAASGGA